MNRRTRAILAALFFFVTLSASPQRTADQARNLSPYYRHWLDEEVTYIINTDERKSFLALRSDVERENYINAFWEARNPTPGTTENSYKEEHYRRLAYVGEHFGSVRYQDGWRTDMGRVYITLGPPQQIQPYHFTASIRDMEIWFYQTPTPALPSYFNVLFFRPGHGEEYKIYSPINDGPYRLVTTGQQNNKSAIQQIKSQLGGEIAHAALSLIPSEPVDFDSVQPTMTSDLMLNTLRNLPDNPLEKQRITLARAREKTVSSVIVSSTPSDLESTVYRDSQNRLTLSYLLRNHSPVPSLIGKRKEGNTGYSLNLRTSLFTDSGALIYEQQSPLDGVLTDAQAALARTRNFGAEDRLPILPGSYRVEIALRNNLTAQTTLFRNRLNVPEVPATQLSISGLQVYGRPSPVPDPAGTLPFAVAGLRFAPHSINTATIHAGDRLPLVFQIHLPAATSASPTPPSVQVHYVFGTVTVGAGVPPTETEEAVSTTNADGAGNILTGHTLETQSLNPGSYRVLVHVIGAAGTSSASSSLQLQVVPADAPVDLWTAYGPEPPEATRADDVKRGLISQAADHWAEAATWYKSSLAQTPADARSLHLLAFALSHLKQDSALAALASQPQLLKPVEPETVLLIATALEATGATPRALSLLEAQIGMQPPNAALLNAVAGLYDRLGNPTRARDFRERARTATP